MMAHWSLFILLSLLLLVYRCNGETVNAFYCGFEMTDQEFQSQFETTDRTCVTLDDQVAYRGKKSLRLANPDGGIHGAAVSIPIDATSGPVILEISGAVKVSQVQPGPLEWMSARFYVHTFDQAGNAVAFRDIGRYHYGTADWTEIRRIVSLPKGTTKLRLNWSLNNCHGTAWFDEIKVVDKTSIWKEPESTNATITVEPKRIVGKMKLGIGWNWETVSPERFSNAEASTWDELFKKMDYDGTDWIRMGVNPAFYVPAGYEQGKDTGQEWIYQVDNRYTRQLVRLLEHCEKRGIPVLLCNWGAGGGYSDVPNDHWLATGFYDPSRRESPDWLLPYSDKRFVEGLCALVKYFKVDKGFSCIKYLSIWNEPDGTWMYQNLYPRFFRIYELLDAELKKLGLRDKIKILGPESIEGGISAPKMARDVISKGNLIDVAAVHDYACGTPAPTELTSQYKNQEGADGFAEAIRLLRASKRDIPVTVTELGGIDLSLFHDARTHFLSTLGIADYVIRCIKAGVDGFLRWQYNDLATSSGDKWSSQFEPFGLVDGKLVVRDSLYWGYAVITRWTTPGSTVMHTQVSGGEDKLGIRRVEAVVLKSPSGFETVLLVNSGRSKKSVKLRWKGAQAGGPWKHFYYDGSLPAFILEGQVVCTGRGEFIVEVPAESINVITNCKTGLSGDAPR